MVAAPSVYPANLSIASVEGQEVYANYVLLGDEKITYTDSQTSFLGLDSYVSLLKIYGDVSDDLAAPYDYVMVPGYGADSDYEGIDVTGKIAVVQRGGTDESGEPITFVTKIQNALWKNAIGILVYNNDTEHPDDCSIRMSTNYYQLPDTFEGTTLSLSDTTAFLFTGEQQQLVAFDTDTTLTWTSNNADVASVDENGLVTAKAPGVTTVTATTANGASVSCVVGVSDQLTYTGLRLDFDEMTTTMYFDSTIDLPGVYLEPYGFALSGKHNTYGTDGLTWSVSDPTIADLDEYSKTTLVANKDGKSGDVTVTAEYQGMTASFTVHVGPYPGSVELYHGWIQARSNRIFLQGKQGIVGAGRDGIHATDTAATSDDQIITFTNSDPNVVDLTNPVIRATSNRDLPDECAYVDARNPGNAVITATATSTTQDTVQCFVTVVPKWYDGIQATQDTIQLKLGQGADLTQYLTLLDESGVVIPELNPVNYASLDESILSVDASGHVTALHTGTGMVRALLNTGDYALIAVEVTCDHDHTTRTETPATCTQDGSVTVTCDDCGAVLSTETMPATGHDYKDGKCTVCGAADPDYRPEQPENPGQPEKPEKPEQPENPGVKTGDSGVLLYMGLMTVCALGACLTLRRRKAR